MTDEELKTVVFTDFFNKKRFEPEKVEKEKKPLSFKIFGTIVGLIGAVVIVPLMIVCGILVGIQGVYESLKSIVYVWIKD